MPASALTLAASSALRVASLNLCTDEYALLLASPGQLVSVSNLSRDPAESRLWRLARRYPGNDGSLENVLVRRPHLVLTMGGGGGRASAAIARKMGIRLIDLPYPATLEDVQAQALEIASALGNPARARPYRFRLDRLRSTRPPLRDGAFVSGGGLSLSPQSLGAQWLALAGFRQRPLPGARLGLETLASNPPAWLVRSDYRAHQTSRGQAWLTHPLVRRLAPRTLATDGRAWTCAGLPMIGEIERLRRVAR